MKGLIYIAGAFHTVNRSKCGQGGEWIDNDPHFWTAPPTWGICRNDLRRRADDGDYIFFVLPKHARHPQMVFAYMKIAGPKITHGDAFHRAGLRSKRMRRGNPNGNILVDANGDYSEYDGGFHRHQFLRIKDEYAIGDPAESRMLRDQEIEALAPQFVPKLRSITGKSGDRAIDIISRKGRELREEQVNQLLLWLGRGPID